MSNLGYSFIPVHPGEIIKEELQSAYYILSAYSSAFPHLYL